jgi:predicted nucleic acid-binding protein
VRYLVDTNVLSELGKGARCHPGVAAWYRSVAPEALCLSALVIGELRAGVEGLRRRNPGRAGRVDRALILAVDLFADRIIGIDRRVAERWGTLEGYQRTAVIDGLIAATALINGLIVVTRNVRDFAATGVGCLNPFAD